MYNISFEAHDAELHKYGFSPYSVWASIDDRQLTELLRQIPIIDIIDALGRDDVLEAMDNEDIRDWMEQQ